MEATLSHFAALISLFTRVLLTVIKRLPDVGETIRRAEADEATLADNLLAVLLSLTGEARPPQPEAQPVPEAAVLTVEVVAEFALGGQNFDAVRVKWTGETALTREEAIRAADTDGGVIRTEEQWSHVYEHRRELPEKLNRLWLITARPDPVSPRYVSYLFRGSQEWCEYWHYLAYLLNGGDLVLRRRT